MSRLISNNNMCVQQFEQNVKGDIAARKLLSTVAAAVSVSDKDVTEELKKQDTKVKFEYAVVSLDDIKKQIKPTDAELKAFYEQNKQQYANSIPEKIKAKYILIDINKLEQQVTLTPAELQQYYKQHQDEYRIPETVTVRHILIKTPDGRCERQGGPEGRRCRTRQGGGRREATQGGREFRRLGEEILRRSRISTEWRFVAADHAWSHGARVRASRIQYSRRPDHGHHSHQLRLPHHPCRSPSRRRA